MAHLHVAQIAYLTQELIEHLTIATNLVMRSKYELEVRREAVERSCFLPQERNHPCHGVILGV